LRDGNSNAGLLEACQHGNRGRVRRAVVYNDQLVETILRRGRPDGGGDRLAVVEAGMTTATRPRSPLPGGLTSTIEPMMRDGGERWLPDGRPSSGG